MNERIKLLAEQAGPLQEVLSEIYGSTPSRYVRNKALLDFQLEKFAELIVQECASICYNSELADSDVHAQNLLYEFNIDNARNQK